MEQERLTQLIREMRSEQQRLQEAIEALERLYLNRGEERAGAAWLRRHRAYRETLASAPGIYPQSSQEDEDNS